MKQLLEYLVKGQIEQAKITFDSVCKKFETIFESVGQIIDSDKNPKENPTNQLWINKRKLSAKYDGNVNADYYYEYSIRYCLNSKSLSYRTDSFYLNIIVFDDINLKRPRYRISDFGLLLPATTKQGYRTGAEYNFNTIKLTEDYYDKALESITTMINKFKSGTHMMQEMYDKCRSKYKNPQKSDFIKIFDKLYKDVSWKAY